MSSKKVDICQSQLLKCKDMLLLSTCLTVNEESLSFGICWFDKRRDLTMSLWGLGNGQLIEVLTGT